jgi:hypothetical protein
VRLSGEDLRLLEISLSPRAFLFLKHIMSHNVNKLVVKGEHLSELLPSLLDRSVDVQFVLNEISIHTCEILGRLGKHISVLLEELD